MEILNAGDIRRLLALPESSTLDFKRDQYALQKGGEHARAELIKDVLAFANTKRSQDALILIGVDEAAPGQPQIVGITEHLKGADIQQLVNEKLNRPVAFRYEHFGYEGVELGVIRIDRLQARPIYLRSDYGPLRANVVYVRRDSSTAQATPDEVVQMGPPSATVLSAGAEGHPAVHQTAERWLSIFDNHRVLRPQIASVLKHTELTPAHFQNSNTLLPILTESLIDETCSLFNIRRAWIDGENDELYATVCLDSELRGVLRAMVAMRQRGDDSWLVALKAKPKGLEVVPNQIVGVLVRSVVADINDRQIFRYLPIDTGPNFEWSNPKYRWYTKRMFLAARYLGMSYTGHTIAARHLTAIGGGEVFPDPTLKYAFGSDWHPDDFVFGPEESVVAKESDDLAAFREDCRKSGFLDRLREARRSISGLIGDDPPVHLLPKVRSR